MSRRIPHLLALFLLAFALMHCDSDDGPAALEDPGPAAIRLHSTLGIGFSTCALGVGRFGVFGTWDKLVVVEPASLVQIQVGELALPGGAQCLDADGNLLVAGAYDQVSVIELAENGGLRVLASLDSITAAEDVALDGNLLAVADQEAGARLYDISRPEQPVLLNTIPCTELFPGWMDRVYSVELEGNLLAVMFCYNGLVWYDITSPESPVELGSVPGSCNHFKMDNGYLYYMKLEGEETQNPRYGLQILDLRDPSHPIQKGYLGWSGYLNYLDPETWAIEGSTLFLLCENDDEEEYPSGCVLQISLADPARPQLEGRLELPQENVYGLGAMPGHLLITGHPTGARIYVRD
jgi:hypothetical protein